MFAILAIVAFLLYTFEARQFNFLGLGLTFIAVHLLTLSVWPFGNEWLRRRE